MRRRQRFIALSCAGMADADFTAVERAMLTDWLIATGRAPRIS